MISSLAIVEMLFYKNPSLSRCIKHCKTQCLCALFFLKLHLDQHPLSIYLYIYVYIYIYIIHIYIQQSDDSMFLDLQSNGHWCKTHYQPHDLASQSSGWTQLRFLALTWSIDLHLEVYNMAIETSSKKILNKPCGLNQQNLPSGKCLQNYGKSPYLMGKSIVNGHFQ